MPRINKQRTLKLFNQMRRTGEEIIKNPDRFGELLGQARDAIEGKGSGPLKDIVDELKLFWAMLNDYRRGRYRKVPVRTIVSIAGVMIYLISPLDAIPDFLPGIGMLDDIFIVNFVWRQLRSDLEDYRSWKLEDLSHAPGDLEDVPTGYITAEYDVIDRESPDQAD